MIGQLLRFGVVGVAALLIHWLVVASLVPIFHLHPLLANVFGALGGVQASYWGHRTWTFEARTLRHRQTLPRFIVVACTSFTINEFLYFLLLRFTPLDYRLALLLVLAAVALLTFVLNRQWAFRRRT